MKKYTKMNYNERRELYKKFLFFLQSKHSSGNEELAELYNFALRYNLLPQFFDDSYYKAKENRPLYKGYLLFLKEKFDVKNVKNLGFSSLVDEYMLHYFEIELYEFPSFDKYMEKSTEISPRETVRLLDDLYRSFYFNGLRWHANKKESPINDFKVKIINEFQDKTLNKNEINIKAISDTFNQNILQLQINEKDKLNLQNYLTNVTNSITYHNALRQMNLSIIDFFTEHQKSHPKLTENQQTFKDNKKESTKEL